MTTFWRRSITAAFAVVLSIAGPAAFANPASAQPVETGTLSFSGDPGDWITGGGSYAYDTGNGDVLSVYASDTNSVVSISLDGAGGDWWYLDFEAPQGQPLTAGTTYSATRYPFNGAGAGFDLHGQGRGCNTLTATFTVVEASFGDGGYVESFHATFEQHCDAVTAAARGEVHITNSPPPAALTLTPVVADTGTVSPLSGRARVSGEVSCTQPVTVDLRGDLSQVVHKLIVRGEIYTEVACTPGAPVPWTTVVTPSGDRPFAKGRAEAAVTASGFDSVYTRYVHVSITAVVTLSEASPAMADF